MSAGREPDQPEEHMAKEQDAAHERHAEQNTVKVVPGHPKEPDTEDLDHAMGA
jgi:hypothetical protein